MAERPKHADPIEADTAWDAPDNRQPDVRDARELAINPLVLGEALARIGGPRRDDHAQRLAAVPVAAWCAPAEPPPLVEVEEPVVDAVPHDDRGTGEPGVLEDAPAVLALEDGVRDERRELELEAVAVDDAVLDAAQLRRSADAVADLSVDDRHPCRDRADEADVDVVRERVHERDIRVGATLDDGLEAMRERVGSYDLNVIITAILIQRSVGSNLSEVLDKVAETIRERVRLKGEIKTLTSQKKLSGWVVGLLPVAIVLIILTINFEYMQPLFTTGTGRLLIATAVGLDIAGIISIRRIVSIDI